MPRVAARYPSLTWKPARQGFWYSVVTGKPWTAWWSGELQRPMVVTWAQDPAASADVPRTPRFMAELPLDLPAEQVLEMSGLLTKKGKT